MSILLACQVVVDNGVVSRMGLRVVGGTRIGEDPFDGQCASSTKHAKDRSMSVSLSARCAQRPRGPSSTWPRPGRGPTICPENLQIDELRFAEMSPKMRRSFLVSIAGVMFCLSACKSDDGDGQAQGSSGQSASSDAAPPAAEDSTAQQDPQDSPGETRPSADSSCAPGVLRLGHSSLRRLTPLQYENSVKALLEPADLEVPELQASLTAFGFSNFAAQQVPSALVIQQFQRAALEVTRQALPQISVWTRCDAGQHTQACGVAFLEPFVSRAFRRPMSAESTAPYLDFFRSQFAEHGFEIAVSLTVQAILQAPEFLYHLEQGSGSPTDGIEKLDDHSIAARLSFLIWNSLPDQVLIEAAQRGELATAQQVRAQARRMLADDRAKSTIRSFFEQWLDLHKLDTTSLDPATYPTFTPQTPQRLREGLLRRVEHVVFSGEGTLDELLLGREAWVTPELAAIYGVSHPGQATWELVELPGKQRAGLLTDAAWLASRAHAVHPSPVQRGVFVLERMLCEPPYPPPADADTTPPKADPQTATTNRERYIQHVLDPACAGCHKPIDGIGMGFEHYDALGRWRDQDNGIAVDASGELFDIDQAGTFDGALELSSRLSASTEVQSCVATQLFRYSMGRDASEQDACQLEDMRLLFSQSRGHFIRFIETLTASDAFRYRKLDTTP